MPEPTNEELRQACEQSLAECRLYKDASSSSSVHESIQRYENILRALLSRLDREAEAERRRKESDA